MRQFAAMMMFAAWILYGSMPAMALSPAPRMPSAPMSNIDAAQDHAHQHDIRAAGDATGNRTPGDLNSSMQELCPHGSMKGCAAPFCGACLVLLPAIAFADSGRFIHPYPEPEGGPSIIVASAAPPTPPPRA